jgi:cobalt-zinc-cadmium efflux system outer membrane protein
MRCLKPFVRAALTAAAAVLSFAAQEGGLTLEKAVELALARNPDVLAARAGVEAARGRSIQLGARPEPQLQADVGGLPIPGLEKEGDEVEFSLGIEQVFEYPGKRSLRAEVGKFGESLAAAELERAQLIVAAKVKRAYWKAAFARGAAEALERSAARLDVLLADVRAKYGAGAGTYADVLRAQAEKARMRNQILEQRRERRAAGLELNELLANPPDENFELLTGMPFAPLGADLPGTLESARQSRPSARIAALRRDRAAAAVRLAGLGRNPDFLAGFYVPSKRLNGWGLSFGMTLPFLQPARGRGAVLEAGAEAELARIEAEAFERRFRSAVEAAYVSAKAAEEQVLVFEKSLLRELEDELVIQLDYFRYGKTDAYSLLDLHRTFVLAELERLRALLLFNLALADLEVAGEEPNGWRPS